MAESLICTQFHRSPCCVQDLHYDEAAGPIRVEVAKAIELTEAQYQHFTSHMLEDMPFIAANCDLTGCDEKGVNHCLLWKPTYRRGEWPRQSGAKAHAAISGEGASIAKMYIFALAGDTPVPYAAFGRIKEWL